jgi:hypothetical protein
LRLPANLRINKSKHPTFTVRPFLFNIGINHEAYFAQKWGENQIESQANVAATQDMQTFVHFFMLQF